MSAAHHEFCYGAKQSLHNIHAYLDEELSTVIKPGLPDYDLDVALEVINTYCRVIDTLIMLDEEEKI